MVQGELFVKVTLKGAVYPSQIVVALPLKVAPAAITIEMVGVPVMSDACTEQAFASVNDVTL